MPVPSFAGFEKDEDEQKAMSEGLSRMRHRLDDPAGLGKAGLASSFVDLGHCKVKLGGTVALVLPAAAASGKSWRGARDLLKTRYRDITVASLAVSGSTTRAFSADTGMADILIVATRTTDSEEADGTALFANLLRRPASLFESSEIARDPGEKQRRVREAAHR